MESIVLVIGVKPDPQFKEFFMATSFAEALASTPKPLAVAGFATVDYTPSVYMTTGRRVRKIYVLLCDGVVVDRGSLSDFKALLGHAPTVARWRAQAAASSSR